MNIMETAFFILLILVVWITLYNSINKAITNTDSLRKEVSGLRKLLESLQNQRKEASENQEVVLPVEEKHIPILGVEMRPDSETHVETEMIPEAITPLKSLKIKKPVNYERYIGENLFGKIGILILVVGMGLFVKYAIDKDWINELFRTIMGFVVGAALIVISERLKKTYRTFSSLLSGGAFAICYVTVGMAYHYYGLFSQTAAFIILVILTLLMSALSVFYNRRELAIIALAGGFISPFLVSDGVGSYLVLFTYVSILNGGMLGLSLFKKWGELPVICFIATYLILLGYSYAGDLDLAGNVQLSHLLIFSTLFYLIFLLPVVSVIQTDSRKINQLLMKVIVLNNFIFLLFGLWFLGEMQLEYNYKGTLTLFIALVNMVIAFIVQRNKVQPQVLFTTFSALALTFVSLTIPIQLEGTFITLFWASEMVVVLWLLTKWRIRIYEIFSLILFFLTVISYLMDIEKVIRSSAESDLFVNGTFATGIFVGIALLVFALLLERSRELFLTTTLLKYSPFNAMALLAGSCVLYLAVMLEFTLNIENGYLSDGLRLVFTVSVAFLLLVLMRKRFSLEHYFVVYSISLGGSACWYLNTSLKFGGAIGGTVLQPLEWGALIILIGHICFLSRQYYRFVHCGSKQTNGMTIYISILSTALLALAVNNLLSQLSLEAETNAGFSISLSIAGFCQMALGMCLHMRSLRLISLVTFGIVLLKLILIDLWLMPTIGKIIVFIILGIILLVLSFLYQKLKQVLFGKD